jgi:hypothetical protein
MHEWQPIGAEGHTGSSPTYQQQRVSTFLMWGRRGPAPVAGSVCPSIQSVHAGAFLRKTSNPAVSPLTLMQFYAEETLLRTKISRSLHGLEIHWNGSQGSP